MPYSLSQTLDLLKTTELTPQALANLASQVSIEASGAVTVLYGGRLPDGSSASAAVTAMVANGDDIRVIDKSPAGRFLSSDDFKAAAAKVSGLTKRKPGENDLSRSRYTRFRAEQVSTAPSSSVRGSP